MYKEVFIDFNGQEASVLIHVSNSNSNQNDRTPCLVVGLSSHYHDKFSSKFSSKFEIVLIDLYWTDTTYEKNYIESLCMKDMADHIERVRQALEEKFGERYKKIIVLGHSCYGFLCLEYAQLYGANVLGVINAGTPTYFDKSTLQRLQTHYINSNFGLGTTTQRHKDYYAYKSEYEQQPVSTSEKQKFVDWYISMGPILWKERALWQNQDNRAALLWEPWSVGLDGSTKTGAVSTRDVNIITFNHFFSLAEKVDYRNCLPSFNTPVLWVIGLFDARVSLYFFDAKELGVSLSGNEKIELCYTDTGHWPMYEKGHDKFDCKSIEWLGLISKQDAVIHEEILSFSKT